MADYRTWCHSCGAEITFGSHKRDCAAQLSWQAKIKQRETWENDRIAEWEDATNDEVIDELVGLHWSIRTAHQEVTALERRFDLMRNQVAYRRDIKVLDDFRARIKERG